MSNPDVQTDAPIVLPDRICGRAGAQDQLLYFTSSSLTADDRHLVVIGDETGHPNLFSIDLQTHRRVQLSDNSDGILKSYVYFSGRPYCGFGKASVSLDPVGQMVYYIQGNQIVAADMQGRRRILADLPAKVMTAFTHVSSDGSRLCVPVVDARALDDDRTFAKDHPGYDVDQRVRSEGLASYLLIYDTKSGRLLASEPVVGGWVTHVQFSPTDPDCILYNHEWCSESGIRRMWLWDGKTHRQLRTEEAGRSREDWTCHEMWERDGSAIIYHGKYHNGPAYIGRLEMKTRLVTEIPLPVQYTQYGHFTVGGPGMLVSDGYYQAPGDQSTSWGGQWISVQRVDWQKRLIHWIPLCRHGSSWRSQDEHPHPIFNHAADQIYFTSDQPGHRAVYRMGLSQPPAQTQPI